MGGIKGRFCRVQLRERFCCYQPMGRCCEVHLIGFRKIGSLENFAKAVESPTTHKKIEYHCSDVEKTSIHQENILTPLLKWGGIAQDTVVGGAASMMDRNSHEDGVVQKTKTFVRSSWNTLRGKFNDMRHAVAERFQSKPEAA